MDKEMFTGGRSGHDRDKGFYKKFNVERVEDPENKHIDCEYFVLDLTHDKFAPKALLAYANACKDEFPILADDIYHLVEEHNNATTR